MIRGWRPAAWLLAASLAAIAASADPSGASVGKSPRFEISCLRSQVVLKPEGGMLSSAEAGEKVRLNQVTICKEQRRACFEHQEEVPMSRCSASP